MSLSLLAVCVGCQFLGEAMIPLPHVPATSIQIQDDHGAIWIVDLERRYVEKNNEYQNLLVSRRLSHSEHWLQSNLQKIRKSNQRLTSSLRLDRAFATSKVGTDSTLSFSLGNVLRFPYGTTGEPYLEFAPDSPAFWGQIGVPVVSKITNFSLQDDELLISSLPILFGKAELPRTLGKKSTNSSNKKTANTNISANIDKNKEKGGEIDKNKNIEKDIYVSIKNAGNKRILVTKSYIFLDTSTVEPREESETKTTKMTNQLSRIVSSSIPEFSFIITEVMQQKEQARRRWQAWQRQQETAPFFPKIDVAVGGFQVAGDGALLAVFLENVARSQAPDYVRRTLGRHVVNTEETSLQKQVQYNSSYATVFLSWDMAAGQFDAHASVEPNNLIQLETVWREQANASRILYEALLKLLEDSPNEDDETSYSSLWILHVEEYLMQLHVIAPQTMAATVTQWNTAMTTLFSQIGE